MAFEFKYITGPLVEHGVQSADDYRRVHLKVITRLHASGRVPIGPEPFRDPSPQMPEINGGRWIVYCDCKNAASASPEWDLACCFECGAEQSGMTWPSPELRAQIEAVLMCRAKPHRNWTHEESLETVVRHNRDRGDRVPDDIAALFPEVVVT